MVQFVSDDDRNFTRPFLAFVHGQLVDPNRLRVEFDDPRFRYQVGGEICSLLDDGTLDKAPHIRLLADTLTSDQVVALFRVALRRFEEAEETWRPAFEKAFAKHVQALPPPLPPLAPPRDVAAAAKSGDIERVLRMLDAAELQHAVLVMEDAEVVAGLAEEAGHPELGAILEHGSYWGEDTPLEIIRNAARDGIAQAQLDLAVRMFDTDARGALKWAERAAAQHLPRACAILGGWLDLGIGVPANPDAARRCYERSAELGDPEGMYRLGEIHRLSEPVDNEAAFFWLTESAMLGHSDAKVSLGNLYEYGEGREPDAKRAFALYSEAADADDELGVMEVARCHADGVGTPRNLELAFRRYQQAANLGYEDAYRAMGWAYANGLGVEKDTAKAIDSYERAISLGSAGAAVALGGFRLNNDAPAEALRLFRKAEELGYEDDVSYLIASALKAMNQSSTPADAATRSTPKSGVDSADLQGVDLESTRRAAESGDVKAMLMLGRCYVDGAGVAEDRETGLKWLRRAAATSNDAALCALADEIYGDEPEEAARLYERAAVHGFPEAQFQWAHCLEFGRGTAQDEKAAVSWYRRSAAGHMEGAQHRLGLFYLNGTHGLPKDEREGLKLLKLAAEKWHDPAMEDLAAWYLSRPDASPELDRQAVELLRLALKGGGEDAYCNLAFCYREGRGVEKNLDEAERLYLQALEEGYPVAYSKLAHLSFQRDDRAKALEYLDRGIAEDDVDSMITKAEDIFDGPNGEPSAGFALLRKAAEIDPDDADASVLLGQCLMQGLGTEKNLDEALKLFHQLAEDEDDRAYPHLATIYRERGEEAKALEWLNRGVRENQSECMVQLAQLWLQTTTSKDEWAVQLLRKAVDLENSDARFLLGYSLGFDRGGSDIKEAERLLSDESLQEDEEAVTYLMFLYLDRLRDVPRAVETARRGAELESSDCMTMLGVAHELGVGAPRDFEEAMRWYQKALKLSDLGAMLHLARISLDRSRPLHNPGRAFSLLEQATKHEDFEDRSVMVAAIPNIRGHVYYQMGLCWEHGAGTPANLVKAIVNYKRASEAGSKEGAAALARLESPG